MRSEVSTFWPEAGSDVRAVVDDHHVHVRHELVDRLAGLRVGEVQGEGLLAAVQSEVGHGLLRDELGVQPPGLTLDRLDLDHVCTEVGQQLAAHGAGDDLGELEEFDAV